VTVVEEKGGSGQPGRTVRTGQVKGHLSVGCGCRW
jgi:hypothetical protein